MYMPAPCTDGDKCRTFYPCNFIVKLGLLVLQLKALRSSTSLLGKKTGEVRNIIIPEFVGNFLNA